jgi:hypothetical protein
VVQGQGTHFLVKAFKTSRKGTQRYAKDLT